MRFNKYSFTLKKPLLVGICNFTPDSFSDGGKTFSRSSALKHINAMVKDGAQIIDIGAESTRPNSEPITYIEEINRLSKILPYLNFKKHLVSVDSYKIETQEYALKKGVQIINDINGGSEELFKLTKKYNAGLFLMHKKGTPKEMQKKLNPKVNMVKEFDYFIKKRLKILNKLNINLKKVWFDPGIGFGKTLNQNLQLMRSLKKFSNENIQVLLGSSRKSWINYIDPSNSNQRIGGSLASVLHALQQNIYTFRIHDVKETNQMIKVFKELNK